MAKSKKLPSKLIHECCDLAHSDKNLAQLKALIAEHPALLTAARPGKDKETPLGAATHSTAPKTIRFLLEQGAERDIFVACALKQHDEVAAMLESAPALVKARAPHIHKMDLMDLAPDQKMVRLLLDHGFPMSIYLAAQKGLLSQVKQFLKQDPQLLRGDGKKKEPPLFNAIWGGQDKVALYLLAQGSEPDFTSHEGARPMTYACIWGRSKVARVLLDAEIEIDFIGPWYGYSYLHTCVYWGDEGMGDLSVAAHEKESLKIIRWLFEAGINPRLKDKRRKTAEELARERGFAGRAKLIKQLAR